MNETRDLYLISSDYKRLYELLLDSADEETGEVDKELVAALNSAESAFENVAVNVATVYRMLGEESARFDAEIERLTAIKKRIDGRRERVKRAVSEACERTGVLSVKGMNANISFRASEQTVIDNVLEIPDEYMTETITKTPNKTAIKEAIKAGKDVPGASLKKVQNIQIK